MIQRPDVDLDPSFSLINSQVWAGRLILIKNTQMNAKTLKQIPGLFAVKKTFENFTKWLFFLQSNINLFNFEKQAINF